MTSTSDQTSSTAMVLHADRKRNPPDLFDAFDMFDESEIQPERPLSPMGVTMRLMQELRRGDRVLVGRKAFVVERSNGVTVHLVAANTKGKKMYGLAPQEDGSVEVVELFGGSGDRKPGVPVVVRGMLSRERSPNPCACGTSCASASLCSGCAAAARGDRAENPYPTVADLETSEYRRRNPMDDGDATQGDYSDERCPKHRIRLNGWDECPACVEEQQEEYERAMALDESAMDEAALFDDGPRCLRHGSLLGSYGREIDIGVCGACEAAMDDDDDERRANPVDDVPHERLFVLHTLTPSGRANYVSTRPLTMAESREIRHWVLRQAQSPTLVLHQEPLVRIVDPGGMESEILPRREALAIATEPQRLEPVTLSTESRPSVVGPYARAVLHRLEGRSRSWAQAVREDGQPSIASRRRSNPDWRDRAREQDERARREGGLPWPRSGGEPMSPVAIIIREIRDTRRRRGGSLRDAARHVATRCPQLAAEVMDRIGSYPSSEPELAALQQVWLRLVARRRPSSGPPIRSPRLRSSPRRPTCRDPSTAARRRHRRASSTRGVPNTQHRAASRRAALRA